MNIDRFIFQPDTDVPPTTLGLNIKKQYGLTHVNLFALDENEGQPVSKNFWAIAQQIIKDILINEKIDNVDWTFICGHRRTSLNFSTLHDRPYKLDVSDIHALTDEEYGITKVSLEKYVNDYDGQPPIDVSRGRVRELVRDPEPKTAFCVPCNHPSAKEGVFHCVPAYYDAEHMRDDYEFILVDTKKIIAQLQKDEPDMLDHAKRSMGRSATDWLEGTDIENPRDMGQWSFSKERGLVFCSGQAGLIQVAQDLDLPYFPIAVEKAIGQQNIDALKAAVGYGSIFDKRQPSLDPAYT